ncbi:MAG TPA: potassium-transporting ATPase subunit C [Firmicutes bacterium]|nr:potassium-transporting ATPase subunit C [Bacillota bacterium]
MWKQLGTVFKMLVVLTFLTGIIYPLVITGIAQGVFPRQANGSLVKQGGTVIGSELIGQSFTQAKYFHGRPSAAGEDGYDATASSGSNLGPTNEKLQKSAVQRIDQVREENGLDAEKPIPSDLVLASASGLDPHISPETAYLQISRIAKERGLVEEDVRILVDKHVQGRQLGILGEPRVNVLALNLALDQMGK